MAITLILYLAFVRFLNCGTYSHIVGRASHLFSGNNCRKLNTMYRSRGIE
jgi:hypothetical protein